MRRRGPGPKHHSQAIVQSDHCHASTWDDTAQNCPQIDMTEANRRQAPTRTPVVALQDVPASLSVWPFKLNVAEYSLLSQYVNRFARTYPTLSGPDNPFLEILIPLATQNSAVLSALLALSGVQSFGAHSSSTRRIVLKLRHKALRNCRDLVGPLSNARHGPFVHSVSDAIGADAENVDKSQLLFVLASCGLLLLYEKLSEEGIDSCTPHLQLFSRMLSDYILPAIDDIVSDDCRSPWHRALQFLRSLFLYNDIVRATSFGVPVLSKGYLDAVAASTGQQSIVADAKGGRFEFPHIIARLSHGDLSVTDADIEMWSGRLDWLPSYALVSEHGMEWPAQLSYRYDRVNIDAYRRLELRYDLRRWCDRSIICEVYRIAAMIYKRQCFRRSSTSASPMGNLPSWVAQLINILPADSVYSNMLLWPIGIIAQELDLCHATERYCIMVKLQALQTGFGMGHFGRIHDHLIRQWSLKDQGIRQLPRIVLFG